MTCLNFDIFLKYWSFYTAESKSSLYRPPNQIFRGAVSEEGQGLQFLGGGALEDVQRAKSDTFFLKHVLIQAIVCVEIPNYINGKLYFGVYINFRLDWILILFLLHTYRISKYL